LDRSLNTTNKTPATKKCLGFIAVRSKVSDMSYNWYFKHQKKIYFK